MLSLRTLLRHPLQFAIMTLGIALGVAAMVSSTSSDDQRWSLTSWWASSGRRPTAAAART